MIYVDGNGPVLRQHPPELRFQVVPLLILEVVEDEKAPFSTYCRRRRASLSDIVQKPGSEMYATGCRNKSGSLSSRTFVPPSSTAIVVSSLSSLDKWRSARG